MSIANEIRKISHDLNAKFWGKQGAGGVFYATSTGRVLISHRSAHINEPNTWGVWGGALDDHENPQDALRREIREEAGYNGDYKLIPLKIFTSDDFKYYNFLIVIDEEFTPELDWETQGFVWTTIDKLPNPLHFGLKYVLPDLKAKVAELAI
jgi:8-oxo-dGTP pyrophosphatase MutT (NUDIX family)